MNFSIFSFFSGSGLLDLGFETTGYNIEFVNEYSNSFLNAYKYSRKMMDISSPEYGYWNTDINEYLLERSDELKEYINKSKKAGNIVGFIGGPPCPDFSVAGKNKGKDGENGKLSMTYVDLIISQHPDYFLFENVKGLWRTIRHREFYEYLKEKLHKAGYVTTERLTNALEFGVPQDRDRILLFGVHKKLLNTNAYIGTDLKGFNWENDIKYNLNEIKEYSWPTTSPFVKCSKTKNPNQEYQDLTVEYWFKRNNTTEHPNGKAFFTPRGGLQKMKTIQEGDVSKKSYKRLHRWRYSPTAAYGNNEVHLHPYEERRISAAEAMAIQSLPQHFQLPQDMSLSDMFKTIGNGVPYLLSAGIANSMKIYMEEYICKELQDII